MREQSHTWKSLSKYNQEMLCAKLLVSVIRFRIVACYASVDGWNQEELDFTWLLTRRKNNSNWCYELMDEVQLRKVVELFGDSCENETEQKLVTVCIEKNVFILNTWCKKHKGWEE